MNIDELALKVGATHYSPAPMRAVKGWSFTFEQLQALIAEYEKAAADEPVAQVVENLTGPKYIIFHSNKSLYETPVWSKLYLRPDPRVAELEEQNAILQEQLDLQIPAGVMAQQMRRIGELEKQNEARFDRYNELLEIAEKLILSVSPSSTELLEARDRRRDAKLLRSIADTFGWQARAGLQIMANDRESGEWQPELGE